MSADDEKQKLARVIVDTELGGIRFHVRFISDTGDGMEHLVNGRTVSPGVYDRMLATAQASALDMIAVSLYPENGGNIADTLDSIHTALHDNLDPAIEDSFAQKLIAALP